MFRFTEFITHSLTLCIYFFVHNKSSIFLKKKIAVMLAPRSMRFKYTFIRIKNQQQQQLRKEGSSLRMRATNNNKNFHTVVLNLSTNNTLRRFFEQRQEDDDDEVDGMVTSAIWYTSSLNSLHTCPAKMKSI